ncbi:MAG: DUF1844 domain-containing protein [Gemmatimonadota bacterium]|nr:MAG: DUF1844 domain-containing protein [Gemmatimonadota bacterium]
MTEEAQQKVDFNSLVAGLAASAIAVLSQVEVLLDPSAPTAAGAADESQARPLSTEEVRKRVSDGLTGARQLIDTLAVLEEKTKGNLTDEEQQLMQTALSDLRIRFVSLSSRPIPEREEAG